MCVFLRELWGAFYYCENMVVHLVEIHKHCLWHLNTTYLK